MRHVVKALQHIQPKTHNKMRFIQIENSDDNPKIAPIVKFTVQSAPVKEVGVNGLQAVDMLEYVKCLFESLDEAYPCEENQASIHNIELAIIWQNKRTEDRERRKVEGINAI